MPNYVDQLFLIAEWDFAVYDDVTRTVSTTTYYYSQYRTIVHGGHTYAPRMKTVEGLEGIYIDHSFHEFGEVSVTFSNMSDTDHTNAGPFHDLNEIDDFEDKEIRFYLYDAATDTAYPVWRGITKRPQFNNEEREVTITATFVWDAIDIQIPAIPFSHRCPYRFGNSPKETRPDVPSIGCPYNTYGSLNGSFGGASATSCDKGFDTPNGCQAHNMERFFGGWIKIAPVLKNEKNNLIERDKIRDKTAGVPLVFGLNEFKIRPEIIQARIRDDKLYVTFIVSGTHPGLPFDADDLTAARCKLFGHQRAIFLKFLTGDYPQSIPKNETRFPDRSGHSLVAMGCAVFALTKEQIDALKDDSLGFHAMMCRMKNGRKLLSTGAASDNPVRILIDILQDKVYGLGLPDSEFDWTFINSTIAFIGARYNSRVELDERQGLLDWLSSYLATYHLYISYSLAGKLRIGAKRDDETNTKVFGVGGRPIIPHGKINPEEKDFGELTNELDVKYRSKFRQKAEGIYYDGSAQIKAGNSIEKAISEELFLEGIYDSTQAGISAATYLREQLNLDYFIPHTVSLRDGYDVEMGEVIRVNDPDLLNNSSNYLFRVVKKSFNVSQEDPSVTFYSQVYKQSVYAPNGDPLNDDILRGGGDTTYFGRPPDVLLGTVGHTPTLALVDKLPGNDDGKEAVIECKWEYPTVSPAELAELAEEGIDVYGGKYPIASVELWAKYTDESVLAFKRYNTIHYPEDTGRIQLDYHKDRDIQVLFVAVPHNYGHGQLGYVIDAVNAVALDDPLPAAATAVTLDVAIPGLAIGDILKCEFELMHVTAVAGTSVTVTRGYQKSVAEDHDEGTEIGKAIFTYPSATLDLNTPRYTYPVVTGVRSHDRPHAVSVRIDDPNKDATEKFFYYWTVYSGDLATNNPGWYLTDPKTPPSTVTLIKTKQTHVRIPFEEIDAAITAAGLTGRTIYVRVAAKLRENYSTTLSALATGKHHAGPVVDPVTPVIGDLITNEPIPGSNRARVVFRAYPGPDRLSTSTAALAAADWMDLKVERWDKATSTWKEIQVKKKSFADPSTDYYADFEFERAYGQLLRVRRAISGNSAGVAHSPLVDVQFRCGVKSDDLTAVGISITGHSAVETNSDRETDLTVQVVQTTPAATIQRIEIWKRRLGATVWKLAYHHRELNNPSLHVDGATVPIVCEIRHPNAAKAPLMEVFARIISADESYKDSTPPYQFAPGSSSATDSPIDTTVTGPSFPTIGHMTNHVYGNPVDRTTEIICMPYARGDGTKTFAEQGIRTVTVDIVDTVTFDHHVKTVTPDPSAYFATVHFRLKTGRQYSWDHTEFGNLVGIVSRPGPVTFYAGQNEYVMPSSASTLSMVVTPTATSNKKTKLAIDITQPALPILLEKLIVETAIDSGGTDWHEERSIDLIKEAAIYSVGSASYTIKTKVSHEAGLANLRFRITAIPLGANRNSSSVIKQATTPNATTSSDPTQGLVPPNTQPGAPTIRNITIGGREGIDIYCDAMPGRVGVTYYYQFSNGSPGGNYWNPETNSGAASSTAIFPGGKHYHSKFNRRDLPSTFKSGGGRHDPVLMYVRVGVSDTDINGAIRPTSPSTANLNWTSWTQLPTTPTASGLDQGDQIPVKTNHHSVQNLADGAGCYADAAQYGTGIVTELGYKTRTALGAGTTATNISTTVVNGVRWNQAQACLEFTPRSGGGRSLAFFQLPRTAIAGQPFGISFLAAADTAGLSFSSTDIHAEILLGNTSSFTIIAGAAFDFPALSLNPFDDGTSSTNNKYKLLGCVIKPTSGYSQPAGASNAWIEIGVLVPSGRTVRVTRICVVPGEDIRGWTPGHYESRYDPAVPLSAVKALYNYGIGAGSGSDGYGIGQGGIVSGL